MDSIGQFQFNRLSAMPERMANRWEREERSGVDGVALWSVGFGLEPFTLVSHVFAYDFEAAKQLYRSYVSQCQALPLNRIKFGGVLEPGVLYQVLAVKPLPGGIRAILKGFNGDGIQYGAICECEWTLQAITEVLAAP